MSRGREDTLFLPGTATDHLDTIPLLPALDEKPKESKLKATFQRARTVVLREPAKGPDNTKVPVVKPKPRARPKLEAARPRDRRREQWTTAVLAVTVAALWLYVVKAIVGL